jgi:hypothetical protein
MKRHLWNTSINESSCPSWECVACSSGILRLQKGSLKYEETQGSKQSHNAEGFDADWIEYVFTAWATCNNEKCGQTYAISGKGGVEPRFTGVNEWDYFDNFYPASIQPSLKIIHLPIKCPSDVKNELLKAFELYWVNFEACASRIRVALEHLLTHIGIEKQRTDEGGKTTTINLHTRIKNYVDNEPQLGQHLMAIKWLGNTGSHEGVITKNELLDAFEILEFALTEIIQGDSKRIAALAKKLTETHSTKNTLI